MGTQSTWGYQRRVHGILVVFWFGVWALMVGTCSLSIGESIILIGLWECVIYLLGFFLFSSHLILLLMVLELMVIKLFLVVGMSVIFHILDSFFIFIFVIITAREAGVGVALLTTFVRGHGNDLILVRISKK